MRNRRVLVAAMALVLGAGCRDRGKVSEDKAAAGATRLVPVVRESAGQVRRGLPRGAKKLATLLEADPGANLEMLQRAVATARAGDKDLEFAKSTFFSFADTAGIVLRSESDPDVLVTKSILVPFPALKTALDAKSGVVEAFGEMSELAGVRGKPDRQWVAAHPVLGEGNAVRGIYVTGWSLRRFSAYLEDTLKRELVEAAQKAGEKSVPVAYVFVVFGPKVYGAPQTPDIDAEALDKLDLLAKTQSGPYRGQIQITDRTFGVAAERTPELSPETAVAVLLSEI